MVVGGSGGHGNLASLVLSLLDKTDRIVTILTAAFLLYTRSAGVAYFATGASTCSLTVKVIKRAIRQPRPSPTLAGHRVKASYGMPSTHSATITFFATYIILSCRYLAIHVTLQRPAVEWPLIPLVTTPWAAAVVMSRVWLGYHTRAQVVAGCTYGGGLAVTWFVLWMRGGLREAGQEFEKAVWELFGW